MDQNKLLIRNLGKLTLAFTPSGYGNAARATPHTCGEPHTYAKETYVFTFVFFIATRLIALLLSFPCPTDVGLYFETFKNLHQGLTPYNGFAFEYPPLTLVPIYLSGLLLHAYDFTHYYITLASLLLFIDFCCLKICQSFCKNNLSMNRKEIAYMTVLYSLFGLLLFRILYHRLDIIIALFFTSSLILFQPKNSKPTWQFICNGFLGFFFKIIPVFTIPAAIILKAFNSPINLKGTMTKIVFNSIIFISCLIVAIFVLEISTSHNFIKNMLFHEQRGIQIESSYGSFLLFKDLLLGQQSTIINIYGSWHAATNILTEKIAKNLGNLLLLSFYGALFFKLFQRQKSAEKIKISEEDFLDVTLITILIFMSFQRVLSTQFFIWLIPVAAIWLAKKRSIPFLLAFSALFFATFFIFSIDYFALVNQAPLLVEILFFRNLCLLVVTCLITAKFLDREFKSLAE